VQLFDVFSKVNVATGTQLVLGGEENGEGWFADGREGDEEGGWMRRAASGIAAIRRVEMDERCLPIGSGGWHGGKRTCSAFRPHKDGDL